MPLATTAATDLGLVLSDWGEEFTIVGTADSEFTGVLEETRARSEYSEAGHHEQQTAELIYDDTVTTLRRGQTVQRTADSTKWRIQSIGYGIAVVIRTVEKARGTR